MLRSPLEEPVEATEIQDDCCPAVAVWWPQEVVAPGEDALAMSLAPSAYVAGFGASYTVATSHKLFWGVFRPHLRAKDDGNHLALDCPCSPYIRF